MTISVITVTETFRGRWRVTVTGKEAGYDQRLVITGSDSSDGIHPGTVGNTLIVDGLNNWRIQIQHNDGTGWRDSLTRMVNHVVSGTLLEWNIESEDLPEIEPKDWNDLVLNAEKIGPIIEVPIRPFAIEPRSLQMMPDGVFESALGRYFMGVRIVNIWGESFRPGQYVEITPQSRTLLASQGIRIIDAWTQGELQSFNQKLNGSGIVVDALSPFESKTIYFKIDCTGALPHKSTVDFICLEPNPMPDPESLLRTASNKIYVTKSYIDRVTHEMVVEAPEGKLRMALKEAIVDTISGRKGRKRRPTPSTQVPPVDELRSILKELLAGRLIDVCRLRDILECYCECRFQRDDDPTRPKDGRFEYDPFLVLPTRFTYTIQTPSYEGTYGPLPFQDPWWKVLLLIIALVLLVAGMISEGADLAYHDEDLIIGSLEDWRQNDIDAALTKLNDHRSLPSPLLQYLDAQSGEVSTVPVEPVGAPTLGGEIRIISPLIMTKQEIIQIINSGTRDEKRVFKSGARTGLTHGLIHGLETFTRDDDGTVFSIQQVRFGRDPDNDMPIGRRGDSGSVWIHKRTLKLIALNHSGSEDENGDFAWGSLIEDIQSRLGITFG